MQEKASRRSRRILGLIAILLLLFAGTWSVKQTVAPVHAPTPQTSQTTEARLERTVSAPLVAEAPATSESQIFDAFNKWAANFAAHPSSEEIDAGMRLAKERRAALSKLIESDPKQALERALPGSVAAAMPPAVAEQLEAHISARGSFLVAMGDSFNAGIAPQIDRTVKIGEKEYHAFVYGQRLQQSSKLDVPLNGIALGNNMAVHESPVHILDSAEIAGLDPHTQFANENGQCPVTGMKATVRNVVEVGGRHYQMCCDKCGTDLNDQLSSQLGNPNPYSSSSVAAAPATPWTTGPKKILFIIADVTDHLGYPVSQAAAQTLIDTTVNNFYVQTSYNLTSMTSTVTTLVHLPNNAAYYAFNFGGILSDATTQAKAANAAWDPSKFDFYVVGVPGLGNGYAGQAYVGASGVVLYGYFDLRAASHELGHNYGAWHANSWTANNNSVIGPGTHVEYGNPFSCMGAVGGSNAMHFDTYNKNLFGWIPDANVTTVTAGGTYRIYAQDDPNFNASNFYALKIFRDKQGYPERDYFVEFRQAFSSNTWLMNGAMLLWSPWTMSNNGTHLLDTTAFTSTNNDCAIVIGRTFADTNKGLYITPIGKGGTTPQSLDVVVNSGTFPGNLPPVISALTASVNPLAVGANTSLSITASDPNSDPLAYYWDFGDGTFSIDDKPTQTKSWGTAGEYLVQCTVSDMKGGTAGKSIVVKVGAPTTFHISGTVTLGGQPLQGIYVWDSFGTAHAMTNSDGTYTLVGEANGSKSISAAGFDYTLTASGFTNPLTLSGADITGINFTATVNTHTLSGTVTDGATGVVGVTVSDGTHSAVTNASGAYTISGLTNGFYTFNAFMPGYQFQNVQPVEIIGGNVTLNFSRTLINVSGQIASVTAAPVVDIGDGVHTANAYALGGTNWGYNIQVPSGTWNLKATLAAFTITPSNFTNPITVGSTYLSGKNFNGVAGTTYSISGNVTAAGSPLPGAVVSDGAQSSTTDSIGNYNIIGVSNGSYTLTPTLTGATFTPTTQAATVASANVTGKNFTATYPFTITTASPMPLGVVGGSYNQVLTAVAGQTPLSWSLSSGSLPPGLTLNAMGSIAGTPTTSGTFNFTLKATDASSATTTKPIALTINPALSVATTSLAQGTVGASYTQTLAAAGGIPPYLFWWISSGALPAGLTMNSSGVISGTPTAAGPSTFGVTVEDSTYATAKTTLSITINVAPSVTTTSLSQGTVGAAYLATLSSSGGTAPVSWSVSAGALPTGLTLNASGAISGTPAAAGTASFTAKVTDAAGAAATKALSITINPALTITTASLPRFVVGTAYSQTIATSGGTGAATLAISSGSAPSGLSLSAGGVLSGTPTSTATATFTVKATDTVGAVATKSFTMTVLGPLAIVTPLLPGGTVNTAYSYTFAGTGGVGAYNWTVSAGTLPSGLTLATSGALSGTPTIGGTFSFTVSLTDGVTTLSTPVSVVITSVPPVVTSAVTATPPQQVTGSSVSFVVGVSEADGEALTYAWTFGDGATDATASPSHIYTVAGTFTVQVTVTNASGLAVSSTASVVIIDGGADSASNPLPMTVVKMQGSVKPTSGHDGVVLTGSLSNVPKGFAPSGKALIVNVGGASVTFNLNANGQGKSAHGAAALKFKPAVRNKITKVVTFQGGKVAFTIHLTNGTWATTWGLNPNAAASGTMAMTASITLDGTVYAAPVSVHYVTKAKAGGKFSK